MIFKEKVHRSNGVFCLSIKKLLNSTFCICMVVMLVAGCKSTTSSNGEEEENTGSDSETYDLILSGSGEKVGTITTSEITEGDDAYIDDGFFATIKVTNPDFVAPFDINMTVSSICGTWDVQPDEQAEVPCSYEDYLADPSELTVTEKDGEGDSAHPSP